MKRSITGRGRLLISDIIRVAPQIDGFVDDHVGLAASLERRSTGCAMPQEPRYCLGKISKAF